MKKFFKISRRTALRLVLMVILPLLVLIGGAYYYAVSARYASTDDAFVKAHMVSVAAQVSGQVKTIAVHENEPVQAGQVLFRLDDQPYRIALTQAEANLAQVRDEIESLRFEYRQHQAELAQAQADVAYFQREFERRQRLRQTNSISASALDEARHNLDSAQLKTVTIQREIQQVLAQLGDNPDSPAEENPRYRQANAAVDKASLNLQYTVVYAPIPGMVGPLKLQPGDYVTTGTPVFSLVSLHHYIEANFKETDLTYIRPEQPATVKVDAYPGRTWKAMVSSISPASGSEFSLLPPQNASGNWVKVVQRIPVRLELDTAQDAPVLRSGMSVTVSIDTGHEPGFVAWLKGKGAKGHDAVASLE